ncbi:MAG: hypothetical protein Sylvanvirus12_13 [Sylvanvirus sp.]|uniref:Uncharacterized protein n=1 Tax=Sylvanvirus sp. TaxID=2487774 RepID=A0A3G5AJU5_9VIRU|nr:MAG: hypothetical protein Sylvanvirus12_13 [Sylvanvirus sp.]
MSLKAIMLSSLVIFITSYGIAYLVSERIRESELSALLFCLITFFFSRNDDNNSLLILFLPGLYGIGKLICNVWISSER